MTDLSSIVPRLDDVEFEELVERAGSLIPRFAPEWTDHNLHDPGMTIIDLLAWIVDQQVYRVGHVGGRHRTAFAALLGQRVQGPRPAQGLVWPNQALGAERFIRAGTRVTGPRQPELSVVTERDLHLTAAAMSEVVQLVGGAELPIAGGAGSSVLGGAAPLADTSLLVRFDRALSSSPEVAPIPFGVEVLPPPGSPPSPDRPWGPVVYQYRVGAGPWAPVEVVDDGTGGLSTTGAVVLGIPPIGTATDPGQVPPGSELRLRFDRGSFPVKPQIRALSVNVLPVVQLQLEPARRLADGNGQPDQVVELATDNLTEHPDRPDGPVLVIEVGGEEWEEVDDFARSGPDDGRYVVEPGRIRFGNGLNGRPPPPGSAIAHTGLARTTGDGGNLRAGLTWSVEAVGPGGTDYGTNRQPLAGGAGATSISDLVVKARAAALDRQVLLTDQDLASAALDLSGLAVARADVLPGFDRRLPERHLDDTRTLVVVAHPSGGPADPGSTDPNPGYVGEVAARLEPRRVLGERLLVQGPVIMPVDVRLVATVEPGMVPGEVEQAIERVLRCRLAVVARSDGIEPWPLGRTVTATELTTLAVGVHGVATVTSIGLAPAGEPPDRHPIPIPRDGVAVLARAEIEARPFGSEGSGRAGR
jgi:hypothetical protein